MPRATTASLNRMPFKEAHGGCSQIVRTLTIKGVKHMDRQTKAPGSSRAVIVLLFLSLLFLGLGYVRSVSGLVHAFDSGIYLQILSNLESGRGWASSITGEDMFLGHHFQPIVLVLMPVYRLMPNSFTLLLVDWLSISLTALFIIYCLPKKGVSSPLAAATSAIAFFLHPTIASRIFYSFVPEVLSLPCLVYLAYLLARKDELRGKEWLALVLALLGVGLCKENYWLISGWVPLVLALKFRKSKAAPYLAGLAALGFATFLYLFLVWMPAHSNLNQYYGMSYYQNSWVNGQWGVAGKLLGVILNFFSGLSIETALICLLLIPAGLTLFGNPWVLAGAAPALGLILGASSRQVHGITNHYLLGALPFIVVASAIGFDSVYHRIKDIRLRKYLAVLVLAAPGYVTLMNSSGFLFHSMFVSNNYSFELPQASQKLMAGLNPDHLILIDGTLQPLFHRLPHTKVILGFQGNPTKVTQKDLDQVLDVITTNDLESISDCRSLKAGEADQLEFDYEGFYLYCEWLKKSSFEKIVYIPGRLIHLKMKR